MVLLCLVAWFEDFLGGQKHLSGLVGGLEWFVGVFKGFMSLV